MPLIAVEVQILKNMQQNLRSTLLRAGFQEYSPKENRDGFQIWHAEQNEGETRILWRTFTEENQEAIQRGSLERCATVLQKHYWVKLDMPSLYTQANQPTLRVLFRLSWLK